MSAAVSPTAHELVIAEWRVDPARVRSTAFHEVGHFALGCASFVYPKWIRIGHPSDVGAFGSCGVGQPLPYDSPKKSPKAHRIRRRHEIRLAAMEFGGRVAEALHNGRGTRNFLRDSALDDEDDPDSDLRKGFARCAWASGGPANSFELPALSDYETAVFRVARRSLRFAERYLRDNWRSVSRLAHLLARTGQLSDAQIDWWARRFPAVKL